ncbi:hypothetical protein C8Q73DRAFT_662267 [Cubamyces lactineus]|nr:hypothetical protein C8Q73DRAFT_662267 [Cubamyces lactineus]
MTIRFGTWEPQCRALETYFAYMQAEVDLERNHSISCQVLRRIAREPDFARIVKVLSVRAFATDALLDSLESLRHLRAFRWHGEGPEVNARVIQTIAKASGPTLVELSIPYKSEIWPSLSLLKNVKRLSFGGEDMQQSAAPTYRHLGIDPAQKPERHLQELSSVLGRLWIREDGLRAGGASIGMPSNLTELFIVLSDTLHGLKSIFQHCQKLCSLGLMITGLQAVPSLRSLLEEAPASLPNLTSFKLVWQVGSMSPDEDTSMPVEALVAFLQTKTQLRRLNLPSSQHDGPWPFLDLLLLLPNVEVLGLQIENSPPPV